MRYQSRRPSTGRREFEAALAIDGGNDDVTIKVEMSGFSGKDTANRLGERERRCEQTSWVLPCSRRVLAFALIISFCSQLVSSVPMGMRETAHNDYQVPPAHYSAKNPDVAKPPQPRAMSGRAQTESLADEDSGRNPGEEAESLHDGLATVRPSVWSVASYTLMMALASGLGAAPFFIVEKVHRKWLGIANALASGVMIAASFGLIQEGLDNAKTESWGLARLICGLILGLIFIIVSQHLVEGHELEMGSLKGMDARKAIMVMGIMTLHSFSEGLGVGVSYGGVNGHRQVGRGLRVTV
jgi:hypothetical protein